MAETQDVPLYRRSRLLLAKTVCLALLAYLLARFVGWRSIVQAFKSAEPVYVLMAFVFFTPVVIFGKALRWHILAHSVAREIRFRDSVRSYLAGLYFASLTPVAAGELVRGLYASGGKRAELTTLVLADKLVDLTALASVAILGAAYALGGPKWLIPAVPVAAAVWLAWPFGRKAFSILRSVVPPLARSEMVGRVESAIGLMKSRMLGVCAAMAVLNFVVYFTQTAFVLNAFVIETPPRALAIFPLVTLSTLLPLTPLGGVGVRESAAALLLSRFGVAAEVAVNAAFLQYVIVTIAPAMLGALFVLRFRLRRGKQ